MTTNTLTLSFGKLTPYVIKAFPYFFIDVYNLEELASYIECRMESKKQYFEQKRRVKWKSKWKRFVDVI